VDEDINVFLAIDKYQAYIKWISI